MPKPADDIVLSKAPSLWSKLLASEAHEAAGGSELPGATKLILAILEGAAEDALSTRNFSYFISWPFVAYCNALAVNYEWAREKWYRMVGGKLPEPISWEQVVEDYSRKKPGPKAGSEKAKLVMSQAKRKHKEHLYGTC